LSNRNTANYIYYLLEQKLKGSLRQVAILTSDLDHDFSNTECFVY